METKKIKLSDIDTSLLYEGYLWWSDKATPDVYRREKLPDWSEQLNPFVVEGQLINEEESISLSIRFIDGEYLINRFDLKALKEHTTGGKYKFIKKHYLANRLDGVRKLCFKEFWWPVEDELCEMEVLMPTENVFVGFNKSKED